MKEITLILKGGEMIHTHGELLLDASENSLIVQGESGAYINFYWPGVLYYAVSPILDDEGDHANV